MKNLKVKKMFLLLRSFLLPVSFLVLLCCGAGSNSTGLAVKDGGPLSDSETLKYRSCTHDLDCIYTQNGCCDCANGGADIAINLNKLTEFRDNFHCNNVACSMIAAVPACGSGTVSCKSGLCEYIKATEDPHTSSNSVN
ncbi:MAG: hypothetical protein NTY22_00580 [Proteobacteria bacterium]|nr:hypothetical protein [Pseudomonadota bacterium]